MAREASPAQSRTGSWKACRVGYVDLGLSGKWEVSWWYTSKEDLWGSMAGNQGPELEGFTMVTQDT